VHHCYASTPLLTAPEPFGAFASAFKLDAADVIEEPIVQLAQSLARC
jgi:hypothetical protein